MLNQESSPSSDDKNFESGSSFQPNSKRSFSRPELRSSAATGSDSSSSGRADKKACYPGDRLGMRYEVAGCVLHEIAGSDPHNPMSESHGLISGWVDEKARYPGDCSRMTEAKNCSVTVSEFPSKGGEGYFAMPEVYDSSAPSVEPTELLADLPMGELQGSHPSSSTLSPHQNQRSSSNRRSFRDRWSKRPQHSCLSTNNLVLPYGIVSPMSSDLAPISRYGTTRSQHTPACPEEVASEWMTSSPTDVNSKPKELWLRNDLEKYSNGVPIDSHDVTSRRYSSRAQQKPLPETIPQGTVKCDVSASSPASPISIHSSTPDTRSTPTQTQIEELRDLVYIVNQE